MIFKELIAKVEYDDIWKELKGHYDYEDMYYEEYRDVLLELEKNTGMCSWNWKK